MIAKSKLLRLVLALRFCACLAHRVEADESRPEPVAKPPAKPAEVDAPRIVLRESARLIQSSNLVALARNSDPQKWERLFELAQKQQREKDYVQAARNFTALVGNAPADEMKRASMLQLAILSQEQEQLPKAQQILAQYLKRYPHDPAVPEVLLRQGLLYRQMGAPTLALSKFYAVMTTALSFKQGGVDYYQRLVLHAQTEIAETYYIQAKYDEAAEFLRRLLKLESGEINRSQVQFKLVRCLAGSSKHAEVIAQAQEFLTRYPGASEEAEIRFLLASSYKKLDQNKDALRQVLLLLQSQQNASNQTAGGWAYWQQRTGNQIANQMYQEGDYLNALEIYSALAVLDESPAWQLPVWYQIGLIYERLQQPDKATGFYDRINSREKELASDARPGLKTVLDMAKWRIEFLAWQTQADRLTQTNAQLKASPPTSAAQ